MTEREYRAAIGRATSGVTNQATAATSDDAIYTVTAGRIDESTLEEASMAIVEHEGETIACEEALADALDFAVRAMLGGEP